MKKITKLTLVLIMAVGMVMLATGCKDGYTLSGDNSENVSYISEDGDMINGVKTKTTDINGSLSVEFTIVNPNDKSKTIVDHKSFNGLSYYNGNLMEIGLSANDGSYRLSLDGGRITDTAIEYTVSGTYKEDGETKTYPGKRIIFIKQ